MSRIANAKPQSLIAGVVSAAAFIWPAFGAQSAAVPNFSPDSRTGWIAGVPDGETPIGDDFLQPPSGPGPVTFDKAHPYIDNRVARRTGKQSTNRVADLSNPILQPWVREELRKLNQRALTETMLWTPKERCWPIGVPGFLLYPVTPVYFVQTPKEVLIIYAGDAQVRHVYLDVPHSANPKPSWYGESVGHYDGDTLVVDTIGFNDRTFVDSYRTPHTDKLHVVERFRLIDGGNTLEAAFTVEDPGAFYQPWSGTRNRHRVVNPNNRPAEFDCATANDDYFNIGLEPVPTAEKPDF